MRTAVVAVIFGAVVGIVTRVGAAEVVSSPAAVASRAGYEASGQQAMQPPWHRNVRSSAGWDGRHFVGPAMHCGPQCGPQCDPCCEPQSYRLPPCFPRLHAFFCDGYLLSPTPPRPPRCPQCGCHIPDGF